jgi:hypothetical protein
MELIKLHGHGCGQYGMRFMADGQRYFLAADGYWLRKSLQENILPHPIVKLFFSSWKDYKQNLKKLHEYYKANPDVIMLSTHCNETVNEQLMRQEG